MNEPSKSKWGGGGGSMGEKCNAVVMVVGGENNKHKVLLKDKHVVVADHFYLALFSTLKQTHCACMWQWI